MNDFDVYHRVLSKVLKEILKVLDVNEILLRCYMTDTSLLGTDLVVTINIWGPCSNISSEHSQVAA